MQALCLTLLAFAIMLVLARLRVPLAAAIIVGAAALGMFFGRWPKDILLIAGAGVIKPMSIGLLLTITLLLAISEAMRITGQLERIVTLASAFLRRPAVTLAALPALIGLLPMPGGALFSAPMVKSAAGDGRIGGDLLSAVNYWWRHIWEHWWPLYPGVIMAMTLTGSDLPTFAAFQMPLSLGMVATGLLILRRIHAGLRITAPPPPAGTKRQLLRATSGIWIILICWGLAAGAGRIIFGPMPLPPLPGEGPLSYTEQAFRTAREMVPLILGLLGSFAWICHGGRLTAGAVRRMILSKSMLPLLGLVIAVMVFQNMLEAVGAAGQIGKGLNDLNMPVIVVVIVLPFVAGMVTGVAFGFVGVSFPIVIPLVAAMAGSPAGRPYWVLAYACGHLGMMISPIHLCYVVSNRFFGTTFGPVTKHIAAPAGIMAVIAAAYFIALKFVIG
ncbi:MAG: DUF401 family protein [Phycisphaerae bacterium]